MRKHLLSIWFLLLAVISVEAQNDTVVFSATGGFYDEVFTLQLSNANPQNHIRYTINGNRPTAQSALYGNAILLDAAEYSTSDIYTIQMSPDYLVYTPDSIQHCIVIRAAAFDENDNCVSAVTTHSYFIKALGCDTHGLPAVSLCADSLDLFDYEQGIMVPGVFFDSLNPDWTGNYYQKGEEWERPVNVEFYELDNTGINQCAGLRTNGGNGRRFPQKSLKMFANEEYGSKRFRHRFFECIPHNDFKHLALKPLCSSWTQAGVEDHLCNLIARDGFDFETMASRPVVVFLNGEYWGIYYIHEKSDERYLEDHFNIDLATCKVMGNWHNIMDYGDCSDFMELMTWLETADLTNPDDYALIESKIDISSFIDYQIFEMYSANRDWPSNNMRCWRIDSSKWRWFFFDGDACLSRMDFDVFANATYTGDLIWPSSNKSTLMFRKLLCNENFKQRFKHRFEELIDTKLQYEELSGHIEYIRLQLQPEIPFQSDRFGYPRDISSWSEGMDVVDAFLRERADDIRTKLRLFMDVNEFVEGDVVCYPNPSSGELHILLDSRVKGEEIAIYDLLGKKVFTQPFDPSGLPEAITINPSLQSGVYVLRIGNCAIKMVRL